MENVATEVESVQGPAEANQVEPIQKPRLAHAFTRENAREMSRRGNDAKKRRLQELRERDELASLTEVSYTQRQLARTRTHIENVHEKIAKAKDAKDVKFLADSLAKLCELEAKLRAPSSPKSTLGSRSSTVSPVE